MEKKISKGNSDTIEAVLEVIQTISDGLPRLEFYQKLQSDRILQTSLLNIFTDVVEFSVLVLRHLQQSTFSKSLSQMTSLSIHLQLLFKRD